MSGGLSPHPSLNIGCGEDIRQGYINIDIREPERSAPSEENTSFHQCDARSLPFPDNTFEHVLAHDILEHFPHRETKTVLKEWIRVLKPGGDIRIRIPDIEKLVGQAVSGGLPPEDVIRYLYGGQDYPENFHYGGLFKIQAEALLKELGCKDVVVTAPAMDNNLLIWGIKG